MKLLSRIVVPFVLLLLWGCSQSNIPNNASSSENTTIMTPLPTETSPPPTETSPPPTNTPTPSPTPIITVFSDIDGMEIVFVPEGEFMMGMGSEEHPVYLSDYWIDKTEVTVAMYRQCYEDIGCRWFNTDDNDYFDFLFLSSEDDFPMRNVTWEMAQDYCLWAGRRLPTEAEWEKAARGNDGRLWPWDGEWEDGSVNFIEYSDTYNPVGVFPDNASPYGVLDMLGNAWEWVYDRYGEDYYQESPYENPLGPSVSNEWNWRVMRGAGDSYVTERDGFPESSAALNYFGFRCASSTEP